MVVVVIVIGVVVVVVLEVWVWTYDLIMERHGRRGEMGWERGGGEWK